MKEYSNQLYKEKYRPQFHFTPAKGWMNDPNGLFYYNGVYHMFFQYNPDRVDGMDHSKSWGHAISTDLIHWTQVETTLCATETLSYWSGSACIDYQNKTGFKSNKNHPIILFYTLVSKEKVTQNIAYSKDGGNTWVKDDITPVLDEIYSYNRDPKVFWHSGSEKWVMVLFNEDGFSFFNSDNMKEWTFNSHQSGYFECPDMFQLPIDGDETNSKWVLVDGNGWYTIGSFDGKRFSPESSKTFNTGGNHFYATQSFAGSERIVQIAWMRGGVYPDMPFSQQMSIPCEMTLKNDCDTVKLYRYPVEEIKQLREVLLFDGAMDLSENCTLEIGISELSDIEIDFSEGIQANIFLNGERITLSKDLIYCFGDFHKLKELKSVRIICDVTSFEIFANNGELSISNCFLCDEKIRNLRLCGGQGCIDLKVWKMKSIWDGCSNEYNV